MSLIFTESGIDGLELTKIWLKKSFDALKDQAAEEGATSPAMLTPAAIVNEAYVSLLSWDENQLFPEVILEIKKHLHKNKNLPSITYS